MRGYSTYTISLRVIPMDSRRVSRLTISPRDRRGRPEALHATDQIIRFCESHLPDRAEAIGRLRQVAQEALSSFPQILEIRLIGSLATGTQNGTQTGTSDVDLLILRDEAAQRPIEELKPYFLFRARRLDVALDVLPAGPMPPDEVERSWGKTLLVAARESGVEGIWQRKKGQRGGRRRSLSGLKGRS